MMRKLRTLVLVAAMLAVVALALPLLAGAATLVNDTFSDGSSQNQNLAGHSIRIYKGRGDTLRTDAVGSATFDINTTSAEAFWGYFANSGSPVALGIGDKLSVSATFSLTGFTASAQDIRFGLLNSQGTRNATDLTGGMNEATFAGDTGYAAQFNPNGMGAPFGIYRRKETVTSPNNPFNALGDFTQITTVASGATARQTLVNGVPYTLTYTVERLTATDTRLSVSMTGGALSNLNYTVVESSASPLTSFDYFGLRFGGTSFAKSFRFTNWLVDYTPAKPLITSQPQPTNLVVQVGTPVTMSVGASGASLSYHWHRDGVAISGNSSALTPTLNLASAQLSDAGTYTAVVTNPGGSATSSPVKLGVSTEPVPPPPSITTQPGDTTAQVGTATALSVTATGENLFYQWFRNGALIPGATQSALNFTSAQVSDAASYTVVVSSSSGSVTSAAARLLVVSTMGVTALAPGSGLAEVNVDAPLRITFNQSPRPGTAGRLRVYQEDGTLFDTIDMSVDSQPNVPGTQTQRNFGGSSVNQNYYPITVDENTATIQLHQSLAYNQNYYVTLEPGVLTDASGAPFVGISDANLWRFSTKAAAPPTGTTSLTIATDGTGDFDTLQGAIDFVPVNNTRRVVISVRRGVHQGIAYVRSNKPFITVRGEDRERSIIQYHNNNTLNASTQGRSVLGVDAADFTLENITVQNTTPKGGSQAEAFRGNNSRIVLNRVNLKSFQDTLLLQGTGFVTDSYIEGDVDFMWGTGAVFFQNSELKMVTSSAYYTQVRNDATRNGYVYVNCRLTRAAGVTDAYLTRIDPDEYPYSQVVFINTTMDAHIRPDPWRFDNPALAVTAANYPNIRFWEYNSRDPSGAPVNVSGRHAISRQLTAAEAAQWSSPSFVLGGWTPPTALTAGVTLGNLSQNYTGAAVTPSVTTDPAGLKVNITYNGSPSAPTAIGSYNVLATVEDAAYQGTATGTLVINPVSASITLGRLYQLADGTPKAVSVNVNPSSVPVQVTYNGSNVPPTEPGRYGVVASINDANYRGGTSATLTLYAPGTQPLRAFPGAEGSGALSRGGRGGDVYHVTNLNDSGAGSLREGIRTATGARTIVFDVSGTIYLNSRLTINKPFLTLAGQTAPGDGITIAGWPTVVTNTQHVVIRYLRFRTGDINCPVVQDDAFWIDKATDVIVDHVSASWSVDETLSVTESDRVTVQWSMITESLKNSCHEKGAHGYGSLIRYGSGVITYHHNLYAHHDSRNPRLGDNVGLDFVNNVVYNFGAEAGYTGEASEGRPRLNYVGNYVIAGPSTPASKRARAFNGASTSTSIYQSNNLIDSNLNGQRDGANTDWTMFIGTYTRQQPARFDFPQVQTDDAQTAYERVLSSAGHTLSRDGVDARLVSEVRNEGGSHLNTQNQVGGWPTLSSQPAPADSDRDGIPDQWEQEHGLNLADPADGRALAANGYSNLENYLNDLVPVSGLDVANDHTPPVTSAALSQTANAAGWHREDVQVTLSADDTDAGTGVHEIIYTVNGQVQHAHDASVTIPVSAEGTTTITFFARDEAGNAEATQTLEVRLDKTAPVIGEVSRTEPNAEGWNNTDVVASYAATDALSGLVSPPQGSHLFTQEGASQTHTFTVEDLAGNTASASVGEVNIDRTAPVIALVEPTDKGFYLLNQTATADYLCQDNLSGTTCAGSVAAGAPLDTSSAGAKSFTLSATDKAGNTSVRAASYTVVYKLQLLYAPDKPHRSGSTIPVRFQLADQTGANLSAATLSVRAAGVRLDGSNDELRPAESAGQSNPEGLFRFDPSLADGGGYIFNLRTKDYASGVYRLYFTVGADPYLYSTLFHLR